MDECRVSPSVRLITRAPVQISSPLLYFTPRISLREASARRCPSSSSPALPAAASAQRPPCRPPAPRGGGSRGLQVRPALGAALPQVLIAALPRRPPAFAAPLRLEPPLPERGPRGRDAGGPAAAAAPRAAPAPPAAAAPLLPAPAALQHAARPPPALPRAPAVSRAAAVPGDPAVPRAARLPGAAAPAALLRAAGPAAPGERPGVRPGADLRSRLPAGRLVLLVPRRLAAGVLARPPAAQRRLPAAAAGTGGARGRRCRRAGSGGGRRLRGVGPSASEPPLGRALCLRGGAGKCDFPERREASARSVASGYGRPFRQSSLTKRASGGCPGAGPARSGSGTGGCWGGRSGQAGGVCKQRALVPVRFFVCINFAFRSCLATPVYFLKNNKKKKRKKKTKKRKQTFR